MKYIYAVVRKCNIVNAQGQPEFFDEVEYETTSLWKARLYKWLEEFMAESAWLFTFRLEIERLPNLE
ncbi:MAG: hypothetical protein DWQ19_09675 [Crenarchaeota archaeon]|nr:MAG: hypothetical protein DWQ19_09675 [Thermoproteota archaeon]